MEEDVQPTEVKGFLSKKAPLTLLGVFLLGIAVSALYDLIIKPGLNGISRVAFDTVTFSSQRIKDYSFSTAALDPTAIPSILLLIFLQNSYSGDGVIVIVNASNSIDQLSRSELKNIYMRKKLSWKGGESILPVDLKLGDANREVFSKKIFKMLVTHHLPHLKSLLDVERGQ